jgi:hypothetical protein
MRLCLSFSLVTVLALALVGRDVKGGKPSCT